MTLKGTRLGCKGHENRLVEGLPDREIRGGLEKYLGVPRWRSRGAVESWLQARRGAEGSAGPLGGALRQMPGQIERGGCQVAGTLGVSAGRVRTVGQRCRGVRAGLGRIQAVGFRYKVAPDCQGGPRAES